MVVVLCGGKDGGGVFVRCGWWMIGGRVDEVDRRVLIAVWVEWWMRCAVKKSR